MSIFVLGSFEIVVSFCLDSYLWSSFSFRASICRSRSKPRPSALLLCEPSSYPLVLLFSRASIKRPEVTRQSLDLWVHLLELGHGFCHKPDTMTSKAPDLVPRLSLQTSQFVLLSPLTYFTSCSTGDRNLEQGHVSLRPPADRELQGQLRAREEEQAHVPHVGQKNAPGKRPFDG